MTKQEEIDILQSLKGDTYFAQFFGSKDIDQMCQNISNDFAIEGGCGILSESRNFRANQRRPQKGIPAENHDLGMELIKVLDKGFDKDAIYQLVEGEVGIDAIIKFKRKNNLDITDKELDYMISKLP